MQAMIIINGTNWIARIVSNGSETVRVEPESNGMYWIANNNTKPIESTIELVIIEPAVERPRILN